VVSPQVLREYLAAATRLGLTNEHFPLKKVFDNIEIFLKEFRVISDHSSVFLKLMELVKTHATAGKQVHDANIVATMLAHHVTHLLTYNIIDFQRFIGLIQVVSLEDLIHIE
jgi:predicted nucleic acid-binding protein